jgi:hypothetical protein
LDLASALVAGVVAALFLKSWSGRPGDVQGLLGAGLGLVAVSFVATTPSILQGSPGPWGAFRIVGQAGGALTVLSAYLAARLPTRRTMMQGAGWTVFGVASLSIAAGFFSPSSAAKVWILLPDAHAVMAIAWAASAVLAGAGLARRPSWEGLIVPAGFAGLSLSKGAWLWIDVSNASGWIPLVEVGRILAVALLLAAVLLPIRVARRQRRAFQSAMSEPALRL